MQDISFVVAGLRDHAFLEQPQFQRLLGNDLLHIAGLAARSAPSPHWWTARAVLPASRFLPASMNSFDQV
jgi:hypothetical protein